eukprot:1160247-Pelagomonas_calceolata.AAC.17
MDVHKQQRRGTNAHTTSRGQQKCTYKQQRTGTQPSQSLRPQECMRWNMHKQRVDLNHLCTSSLASFTAMPSGPGNAHLLLRELIRVKEMPRRLA